MNKIFAKGHRLRNRDRFIPYWLASIVGVPFLLVFVGLCYGLYFTLMGQWVVMGGIATVVLLIFVFIVYKLYVKALVKIPFFLHRYREFLLWRFMFQNAFYFTKQVKSSNGTRTKTKFPKVYLKQEKYALSVSFQLEGIKFQDRFLKIGGELETMFSADMMGNTDEKAFITYHYAIDSIRSRISAKEVQATIEQGVKLSETDVWDFVHDPHLLVAGGIGGGKTVFLRSLLVGLLRLGRVEILDPKQADFVSLEKLPVLKGRVTWETEEMGQRLIDINSKMDKRYELMRQRSEERGEEELGAFYKYDCDPVFVLIDEFPSLVSALEDLPMNSSVNYMMVMSALKQIILKGRQAGFYVIISTQNVKADDLPSTFKDNLMLRITLGRVSSFTYDTLFGEENRNKQFKYIEKIGAERIFGRGYYGVFGRPAKEFYAPLLPDSKDFNFYNDFKALERKEEEEGQQKVSVEKRYKQSELLALLSVPRSTIKKIEELLKDNQYQLTGNGYSKQELELFRKILSQRDETGQTLRDVVSEIVSTVV
ncbi:FtsK/SpoIIIE domain-containing protein [Lactococcus protaetiae]|uniref:Cell division protein FtsK n=1 Tax=Lactococcus protaetiae TaxID=2592653 RepID=A0A514Z819_9LACT|nr:FtsK/SpoIIIE domain-containing protein [Lactococcus protaetiae]QDK70741.1 cell division protein FtsK [Lactococcus protaetiae]